jgi:hypothetical protein
MTNGDSGLLAAGNADAANGGGAIDITINSQSVSLADATPDGRKVLAAGGFNPASDHVLIKILHRGAQSIGLDEELDLRHGGPHVFRAYKSDRVFNFTIDERGYEWGAAQIEESDLREVGDVPDNKVLVLERKNEPDRELETGDKVHLDKSGTEHLKTKKEFVTVCIDGVDKEIPRGVYTTEELIAALGVDQGYVLDFINEHGQLVTLTPGQKIRVKKGMKFVSQAPCGGSS